MEIWEEKIERVKNNINPWLLSLVLNKDYINIKMETIKEIIKKKVNSGNALVIHTRENKYKMKYLKIINLINSFLNV